MEKWSSALQDTHVTKTCTTMLGAFFDFTYQPSGAGHSEPLPSLSPFLQRVFNPFRCRLKPEHGGGGGRRRSLITVVLATSTRSVANHGNIAHRLTGMRNTVSMSKAKRLLSLSRLFLILQPVVVRRGTCYPDRSSNNKYVIPQAIRSIVLCILFFQIGIAVYQETKLQRRTPLPAPRHGGAGSP